MLITAFEKKKRILITGSQGTLGRVLRAELESRGHEVYGCDLKHSDNPTEMRADISERRQLEEVFWKFGRFEFVYHLAAEFGRNNGEDYYEQLWKSNCIGTRNVIDCCINFNSKLIYASSSEAYGESTVYAPNDSTPLVEDVLDKYAPAFHNEYALSKYAGEKQVHIAAKNRGLNAVVLRFFNAYGPGEYYSPYRSVVCLFAYRLMKGLPITVYRNYHRVFMWVNDWAKTVANVADRFDSLHRTKGWVGCRPGIVPTYNIGGEEYLAVEEMKDKLLNIIGGSSSVIEYIDAEKANVTNKRPDNSYAKMDLDHNPTTLLDYGLPLTVDWLKKIYGGKAHEQVKLAA